MSRTRPATVGTQSVCHPPVRLLASPRNFTATQHVLLPLPPSLTRHQLCTGSPGPLSETVTQRGAPGEGLSFGRGWGGLILFLPYLPPGLSVEHSFCRSLPSLPPTWILSRTQLLHGSGPTGPALTGQGGGAPSEDELPESGRDSRRGTAVRRPPAA